MVRAGALGRGRRPVAGPGHPWLQHNAGLADGALDGDGPRDHEARPAYYVCCARRSAARLVQAGAEAAVVCAAFEGDGAGGLGVFLLGFNVYEVKLRRPDPTPGAEP